MGKKGNNHGAKHYRTGSGFVLGPAKRVRVRCLGPREGEHTFLTDDPVGHRVCGPCAERQRKLHLSSKDETPARMGEL